MMKVILIITSLLLLLICPQALLGATDTSVERAQELLEAGDFDGAIDILKEAVERDESNSMYRTYLGRAYIAKLQTVSFVEKGTLAGRALEQLDKAVKLDPTNVDARITLAGYYLNAPSIAGGSKKKAREQAEEIVKYNAVEGNVLMARIHVKDEEYDLAVEKLEACIQADPSNTSYRYQLAMIYQKQEQYDQTFDVFEEVLEIDPDASAALYQIGRTAVFSGTNLNHGIACLERYLTLEVKPGYPGYDAAHWRLGMLCEKKGDPTRAKMEYETAVHLNPDNDEYKKSLKTLDRE